MISMHPDRDGLSLLMMPISRHWRTIHCNPPEACRQCPVYLVSSSTNDDRLCTAHRQATSAQDIVATHLFSLSIFTTSQIRTGSHMAFKPNDSRTRTSSNVLLIKVITVMIAPLCLRSLGGVNIWIQCKRASFAMMIAANTLASSLVLESGSLLTLRVQLSVQ